MAKQAQTKGSTYQKGKEAEKQVITYLQNKGWQILATNYKAAGAEVDIIAFDGKELVIVEVKSGTQDGFLLSESVTIAKRKRIERAANEFRYKERLQNYPIRFDVITVSMPAQKIHHFVEEFFDGT
jgi:putative endonuclease